MTDQPVIGQRVTTHECGFGGYVGYVRGIVSAPDNIRVWVEFPHHPWNRGESVFRFEPSELEPAVWGLYDA